MKVGLQPPRLCQDWRIPLLTPFRPVAHGSSIHDEVVGFDLVATEQETGAVVEACIDLKIPADYSVEDWGIEPVAGCRYLYLQRLISSDRNIHGGGTKVMAQLTRMMDKAQAHLLAEVKAEDGNDAGLISYLTKYGFQSSEPELPFLLHRPPA